MQILKNLYQIGGSLNGLTWSGGYINYEDCNTYLLKGEGGCIMFDCGNGDTWPQLVGNMRYWDISPDEIKACFFTHAHMDHTGAAHILASMGVELYAHEKTADALEAGDERCAGYLYHKPAASCRVTYRFADTQVFNVCGIEIKTMHCPGHTAGCTAYFFNLDGKGVVVSGDIIGTLMDGYFGWDGSFDFDRKAYLTSLQKFSKEDTDLMLSGHGLLYFGKPRRRVEDAYCEALREWRK
jgi:glyoxylase-like metal-dependent hydrolase (beta-lactamase superfamily II)